MLWVKFRIKESISGKGKLLMTHVDCKIDEPQARKDIVRGQSLEIFKQGGGRQYVRQLSFLGAQLLQTQDPATDKFPLTVRPVSSS